MSIEKYKGMTNTNNTSTLEGKMNFAVGLGIKEVVKQDKLCRYLIMAELMIKCLLVHVYLHNTTF